MDTLECKTFSVRIGCIVVTKKPSHLKTVLGSCVGIAIWDPISGIGGLAHCLLPDGKEEEGLPGKFVTHAVPIMVKQIVAEGGLKTRLRAKIVGGASLFATPNGSQALGEKNTAKATDLLKDMGLTIVASDIGGEKGRNMIFDLESGDLSVRLIGQEPRII